MGAECRLIPTFSEADVARKFSAAGEKFGKERPSGYRKFSLLTAAACGLHPRRARKTATPRPRVTAPRGRAPVRVALAISAIQLVSRLGPPLQRCTPDV